MQPGDYIDDRFWVETRIGAGGMGVVFRGIDEQTGERVAIKIVLDQKASDLTRARREAMAVALLEHPGIVRHVANGLTPDGELYLVMEWIDGITLAERIERVGLSLQEAVAVMRQVAAALAVAHDAGIVHRDVKPSNVVLQGGDVNRVKLIDFGVARFATVAMSLTLTGMAMGTPGYMAPEQARGNRELTPATDVFGLAALFYECATGRSAFSGAHQAAVMVKVLFSEPPPFAERCPEAPPGLVHLLERMLAKEAPLRPADGAAVVAELDKIGALPDGPRRSLVVEDPPLPSAVQELAHCMVIAARSHPDEFVEPPTLDVCLALGELAVEQSGRVQVLATGAVVGHFHGTPPDVRARASRWADQVRSMLPRWRVVVSAPRADAAAAADHGAQELAAAAIAAIFAGPAR